MKTMRITICQLMFGMIVLVFAGRLSAQTQPDEGFSEPLKTVRIAAPESGVIQSIVVAEGDFVQPRRYPLQTGLPRARGFTECRESQT